MNDSIFFVDPFPVKMGLKLVKIGLNMTVETLNFTLS